MTEENPSNPRPADEAAPELFPSRTEIESIFEKVIRGQSFKVLRESPQGEEFSLYEIEAEDGIGGKIELNYAKAKNNYRDPSLCPEARFSASIHVTYYDESGMPTGGNCLANYLDGVWQYV